jgi:nucleoside-diphosphate-sugar epimerase
LIIVGNGLIAKAFQINCKSFDVIIFASGVSDSKNATEEDYLREKNKIKFTLFENPNLFFVYFSTCGIYDPSMQKSHYTQHKLNMENFVQANASKYIIFRVSNVVGETGNKNTIFNFIKHKILNHTPLSIWEYAYRNLIDVNYLVKFVSMFLEEKDNYTNRIINIAMSENISVHELVNSLLKHYKLEAEIELLKKGNNFRIPIEDLIEIHKRKGIEMPLTSVEHLIQKYS